MNCFPTELVTRSCFVSTTQEHKKAFQKNDYYYYATHNFPLTLFYLVYTMELMAACLHRAQKTTQGTDPLYNQNLRILDHWI